MKSAIDLFLSEQVGAFAEALARFNQEIDPQSEPTCETTLENVSQCCIDSLRTCREFEEQLAGEDPTVLKEVQARYREAIAPSMSKSWIWERSFTKPRGYPGDYQLLTAIYNGVPKSLGFGGYVDRYLLNFTLARAVVARMWSARRFLMEELDRRHGRVAILNVASGACREYLGGFEPSADREVTITCVDNDSEALEFAQAQTSAALTRSQIESKFMKYNALRMTSAAGNVRQFGRSDIIYSVGLCDYIPDEFLIPLLRGLRESLAEGGVVYVAFKDALLYDKTEYQWLMDWYFFQRTEEDFKRLFVDAGYDFSRVEISRDATGVIINYLCRTEVPAMVRVDVPEQMPLTQHIDGVVSPAPSQFTQ